MAFMDKNVNFILVFTIIVILIALTGATLYYQNNYKELSDRYHEEENEVRQLQYKISFLSNISLELNQTLEVRSTDIADLSGQYITEKVEKEQLNASLAEKQTELENTQSILENTKKELTAVKSTLSLVSTRNNALQSINITYLEMKSGIQEEVNESIDHVGDLFNELESDCNTTVECQDIIDDALLFATRTRSDIYKIRDLSEWVK